MSEPLTRPMPRFPEPHTETFWEMATRHQLGYQRCRSCGGLVFYPRNHCTHCTKTDLAWEVSRGEGVIYTFTVLRQHGHPAFQAKIPYVVAFVDLDEGFRLLTEIVDVDPGDVEIGQRVRVRWVREGTGTLPVFTPSQEN